MKNIKIIIAFILGLVISGVTVYALSINSKDVSYANTSVENAIDDLYEKVGTGNNAQARFLGKAIDWDQNTGSFKDITDGFVWDRKNIAGMEYGSLAFPHRKMRVTSNNQYGQYTVVRSSGTMIYPGNTPIIVDKGDIVIGSPASTISLTFTYVDD